MDTYWTKMTQMKFHILYLGYHYHRAVRIDRIINIVIAIVSTGSLAGMFVSPAYQKIWACVIVLMQAVAATKPYLPFSARVQDLDRGIAALNVVYENTEKNWNRIVGEKIPEQEAIALIYNSQTQWDTIDAELLKKDSLPRNKKYIEMADDDKNQYFKNMFGGSND